jgi:hypothetical protein
MAGNRSEVPSTTASRSNHGIAFALTNLTWAAGQAIAASGSGALAEATSDVVPYLLLSAACLLTLGGMLRSQPSGRPPTAGSRGP